MQTADPDQAMTLLATKDLSLTLGQPLFTDLSFTLSAGDRLGLIAANGRGKTTLLRCLAGVLEPTSGDITRARGLKTALVEQEVPAALLPVTFRAAVLAALDAGTAEAESWRVDIVLDDLSVPETFREKPPCRAVRRLAAHRPVGAGGGDRAGCLSAG